MPDKTRSLAALQTRFPVRIPVRMTETERAAIGKNACALNRSISRYLVEIATLGKSAPIQKETTRTKFLFALFENATEKVQVALAQNQKPLEKALKASLEEVLQILDAINCELERGLE